MKKLMLLMLVCIGLSGIMSSCHKGPSCPAYNSVHNSKDNPWNPNNKTAGPKSDAQNKKEIAKSQKMAEKPMPKRKNSYSLFPKGMR